MKFSRKRLRPAILYFYLVYCLDVGGEEHYGEQGRPDWTGSVSYIRFILNKNA